MIWWILFVAWTLFNLTTCGWMAWHYVFSRCEWCHKRYIRWTSTSSCRNVFCSYRCNYWDMRGYLAEEMHLDIAEVEQYMSRRGYAHPDLIGGK